MRIMKVNFEKCKDCGSCEILVPGFRRIYGGIIKIDEGIADQELRAAAERAKAGCINDAIIITHYSDKDYGYN